MYFDRNTLSSKTIIANESDASNALRNLVAATAVDSACVCAYESITYIYQVWGRYAAIPAWIDKYLDNASSDDNISIAMIRAQAAYSDRDYSNAAAIYSSIVAHRTNYAPAYSELGTSLLKLGNTNGFAYSQKGFVLDKTDSINIINYTLSAMMVEKYDVLKDIYEESGFNDFITPATMFYYYYLNGNATEANRIARRYGIFKQDTLAKALSQNDELPPLENIAGFSLGYLAINDFGAALLISKYLRDSYPDNCIGYYALSDILLNMDMPRLGEPAINRALEISSTNAVAQNTLLYTHGMILYACGKYEDALYATVKYLLAENDEDIINDIRICYFKIVDTRSQSAADAALADALNLIPENKAELRRLIIENIDKHR